MPDTLKAIMVEAEVALNIRITLGSLLSKEIAGPCDREVVEGVIENPYLPCFLSFKSFQTKAPFSASLLTHFRKRLPREVVMSLNDKIIELAQNSMRRKMILRQTEAASRPRIQIQVRQKIPEQF